MKKESNTTEQQCNKQNVSTRLSASDHWFDANLRCLLGGEIALVNKGKKTNIDREMIADWIMEHL